LTERVCEKRMREDSPECESIPGNFLFAAIHPNILELIQGE